MEKDRSVLVGNILTFLAILGIVLFIWLIWCLKSVVILILISTVLATGLAPTVLWIEKLKLPGGIKINRSLAILIIYAAVVIVLLGVITLVVVPLVRESIQFSKSLPKYLSAAKVWLADIQAQYPRLPDLPELMTRAQSQLGNAGRYIIKSVGPVFGFFGGVISSLAVVVITYFLLATRERIREGFLSLVPPKYVKETDQVLHKMGQAMGGWLRGQLILAGIVGGSTALAMLLIGVPYPYVIAVIGAIAELVPMVGPVVAAVPAVLLLLGGPFWKIVATIAFFALLSAFDGYVITPKLMQKSVGLSPLLTIIALMVGVSLLGVVGALLAVPLTAALQVLFTDVIAPAIKRLEDENPQ